MVSSKNYGFLIVLCFVYLFQPSHTIQVCPEMAVLERYSTTKCSNRRIYHCLVEDSNGLNNYREECRTPEWVSLGHYPVFRGKYIDYETCPADSYQPFLFRSNEHYKCAYLKSKCSSEGQIYVTGGNKTIDTACRCDYNKGFAFVIIHRNQCACIPSTDDCSCYIKRCSEGETLNPDYQCTKNNPVLSRNSSCPVLIVTDTTYLNIDTTLNSTVFKNLVTPKRVLGRTVLVLPVVIVIFSLSIGITYVTCLSKAEEREIQPSKKKDDILLTPKEKAENQPSKGNKNSLLQKKESAVNPPLQETDKPMSATNIADNSPLLETENKTVISKEKAENQPFKENDNSSTPKEKSENTPLQETDKGMSATKEIAENTPLKETDKRMLATKEIAVTIMQPSVSTENQTFYKKDNSVSISSEKADNSPILETENRTVISKEKAEDQASKIKENSVLTPRENADIVILHIKDGNEKQEVADLKYRLEGISYCGIRYHLFEELFPTEQYNSGIEIQTVLRKCNFIFVYITKDYVRSKLKRFGLKESSINDALEATETMTKIKKLSVCEPWNMPTDKQMSHPDFDFYNFDFRSEDSINKYKKILGDILSNV